MLSIVILGASISARTTACLAVVLAGFIVGVGGEVKLSVLGVQWGLISSVAVSLNSIYTKKVRRFFAGVTAGENGAGKQRDGDPVVAG